MLIEGGRAVGVRARIGEEDVEVRADKVVLCAGAVASPAILLRSGIGPDGAVVRLPVGENMQEHPLALFWLFPRPDAHPRLDARQANCCLRYSSGLAGAGENDMIIASVNQTLALPRRRHLAPGGREPGLRDLGRRRRRRGRRAVPGCCASGSTSSSGAAGCALASPDPDVHPLIDQDLLNVDADLVRARDGVKRSLELLRSGSFDNSFGHIAIDMTGRGLDELSDDAAIDAWLMETIGDTGHICGTCRMGSPDDPSTVVDPHGRVLGVDGL